VWYGFNKQARWGYRLTFSWPSTGALLLLLIVHQASSVDHQLINLGKASSVDHQLINLGKVSSVDHQLINLGKSQLC
jgi:hypothetical protein